LLSKEEKSKIIKDNRTQASDTGSPEVQIALMTHRINYLAQHFDIHKKDFHSRTGLMKLVGQRKRLLEYLKREDPARYEKLIKKLKLRK
jgi:small subunit ribosomal protein S15